MKSQDPISILEPYDPDGPRYSRRPFPPYRHVPGLTPHPVLHPQGHLFGRREPLAVKAFDAERWRRCQEFLYGVDLFNFCYFWEAHEAWEGLWKPTPRDELPALFLSGLIQVSAALLKRAMGRRAGMESLARRGLDKLQVVEARKPACCGLNLPDWTKRIRAIVASPDLEGWAADPRIRLVFHDRTV